MTIDMKSLAREGAKARLWQLETEKNDLLRAFPDLRDGTSSRVTSQEGTRRGRRQMTAAERRSVSVRMKKYWAERRQKNDSPKPGPGRPKATRQAQRHLRRGPSGDCCGSEETLGGDSERGQGQGKGHGQELRRQRLNSQALQFTTPPLGAVSFCTVPIYSGWVRLFRGTFDQPAPSGLAGRGDDGTLLADWEQEALWMRSRRASTVKSLTCR